MKSFAILFLAAICATGCASHQQKQITPPAPAVSRTEPQPIVTPDNSLTAKVVAYNSVGRFVVLSFPVGPMPQINQTLFLYRNGLKVAQIKVSGPQNDNNIVADLISGEAQVGDEVRDQ